MIHGRCIRCGHSFESESATATIVRCPRCDVPVAPGTSRRVPLLTRDDAGEVREVGDVLLSSGIIDGYRLIKVVGSGVTGVVYEAKQLGTDRLVAIKFFTRTEDRLRERFVSEGKILAQIVHENVVRLYDVGETDGHPYLVMEYLAGGTLRSRLASGGVKDLRQALQIARQCLAGLEACHSHGVIHRDLKPENILFGEGDVAKIADFGLARIIDSERRMTRTGAVLGTPRYMAPEQVMGQDARPASDIYSFGAILYELIAGHSPFAKAEQLSDLLRDQLVVRPESLDTLVPGVPAPLARLVDAALSKNPAERPKSAAEFLASLSANRMTARHPRPTLKGVIPQGASTPQSSSRLRAPVSSSSSASRAGRQRTYGLAAVGALAAAGILVVLWARPGVPRVRPTGSVTASASPALESPSPSVRPQVVVELPAEYDEEIRAYDRLFKAQIMDFVGMLATNRETASNPGQLSPHSRRLVDCLCRWMNRLDREGLTGPRWLLVEGPFYQAMDCVSGLGADSRRDPISARLFLQIAGCVRYSGSDPYRRLLSDVLLSRLELEREWTTRSLEAMIRVCGISDAFLARQAVAPADRGLVLASRVGLAWITGFCQLRLSILSAKITQDESRRLQIESNKKLIALVDEVTSSRELFESCLWRRWAVSSMAVGTAADFCRSPAVDPAATLRAVRTVSRLLAWPGALKVQRRWEPLTLSTQIEQIESYAKQKGVPFDSRALRHELSPK